MQKSEIYRAFEKARCVRCASPVKLPVQHLVKLAKEGMEPIEAKFSVGMYSAGPGTYFGFYLDKYGLQQIVILEDLSEESCAAIMAFLNLSQKKMNDSIKEEAIERRLNADRLCETAIK